MGEGLPKSWLLPQRGAVQGASVCGVHVLLTPLGTAPACPVLASQCQQQWHILNILTRVFFWFCLFVFVVFFVVLFNFFLLRICREWASDPL